MPGAARLAAIASIETARFMDFLSLDPAGSRSGGFCGRPDRLPSQPAFRIPAWLENLAFLPGDVYSVPGADRA
jgi:hypothetical protein